MPELLAPDTSGFPLHARLWWSLGALLLGLITFLSLMPMGGPAIDLPSSDKLLHAFAYIVLSLYFGQLVGPVTRARIGVVLGLVAYGVAIELMQSIMPPRSAELADLGANVCGIGIGFALLRTPLGRVLRALEGLPGRSSQPPRR